MNNNLLLGLALAVSFALPSCAVCTADGSRPKAPPVKAPARAPGQEPPTALAKGPMTPPVPAAAPAPTPTPAVTAQATPAPNVAPAAGPDLGTEDRKTVYALGLTVAGNLKNFALAPEELELVLAGIRDGLGTGAPKVNHQEYQPRIKELAQARVQALAEAEKREAALFLERMAAEQGARKFDSGMIIIPVTEGTGAVPQATDTVKVHYHGTLRDGSVFDSSVDRGQPATFPLNRVIPCWSEGLQRVKVGGKIKLACPSDIAYGDRGSSPRIKPGAALLFEIELLGIEAPGGASLHQ